MTSSRPIAAPKAHEFKRAEFHYTSRCIDLAVVRCQDGSQPTWQDCLTPSFYQAVTHLISPGDIFRVIAADRSFDFEITAVAVARDQGVVMQLHPWPDHEILRQIQRAAHSQMAAEQAAKKNGAHNT